MKKLRGNRKKFFHPNKRKNVKYESMHSNHKGDVIAYTKHKVSPEKY